VGDDDRASNPGTEAFVPDFSDDEDTGTHSFIPDFSDDDDAGPQPAAEKPESTSDVTEEHEAEDKDVGTEAAGAPVQSVTVPGRYQFLKWWQLVMVLIAVWIVVAVVGLGLFYWWYHSIDKTPAVFLVLVYVVVCAVGGVMLAMVEGRPLMSALSVAVMSAPFASAAAAAPLYGYYYCARTGHCLIGLIPY
jgi:hypothetical protein